MKYLQYNTAKALVYKQDTTASEALGFKYVQRPFQGLF